MRTDAEWRACYAASICGFRRLGRMYALFGDRMDAVMAEVSEALAA